MSLKEELVDGELERIRRRLGLDSPAEVIGFLVSRYPVLERVDGETRKRVEEVQKKVAKPLPLVGAH